MKNLINPQSKYKKNFLSGSFLILNMSGVPFLLNIQIQNVKKN